MTAQFIEGMFLAFSLPTLFFVCWALLFCSRAERYRGMYEQGQWV